MSEIICRLPNNVPTNVDIKICILDILHHAVGRLSPGHSTTYLRYNLYAIELDISFQEYHRCVEKARNKQANLSLKKAALSNRLELIYILTNSAISTFFIRRRTAAVLLYKSSVYLFRAKTTSPKDDLGKCVEDYI